MTISLTFVDPAGEDVASRTIREGGMSIKGARSAATVAGGYDYGTTIF